MNPFFHALLNSFEDTTEITGVGETLAYTWFGRPNYAYSEDAQKYWIGSTMDTPQGTTQHITEFNLNTKQYTTTRLGTAYEKDDHNQAQILIRQSDKRLIAFYTEHGSVMRYRISLQPYNSTAWEDEVILDPVGANYNYLSPYQAANGDIFIFFRSDYNTDNFTWNYMKSTDGGVTFGDFTAIYSNEGVQAYLISCQDGDKIHFAASGGHPQHFNPANVNCYHFYFDMASGAAYQSDGTQVILPMDATGLTLVNETTGRDTSWILDITVKNGLPRILYVLYPPVQPDINDLSIKDLYFIEWNGTAWVNKKYIARTMVGYMDDDTLEEPMDDRVMERAYPPASRFDTSNPDIIWMPKQVNGILEIHKVDLSTEPIFIEQITFNSAVDNWRPISVPSPINNVIWLKKNLYYHFTDYSIGLMTKTVQV